MSSAHISKPELGEALTQALQSERPDDLDEHEFEPVHAGGGGERVAAGDTAVDADSSREPEVRKAAEEVTPDVGVEADEAAADAEAATTADEGAATAAADTNDGVCPDPDSLAPVTQAELLPVSPAAAAAKERGQARPVGRVGSIDAFDWLDGAADGGRLPSRASRAVAAVLTAPSFPTAPADRAFLPAPARPGPT
eukprot:SAG11_NODE_5238_length_1620_cov_2.095989_2_plen_195_part_01